MNVVLFGWFAMSVVSLGSLLFNLSIDRRKSVRDLEKLSTKLSKLQCSLLFNNTCLREGLYVDVLICILHLSYPATLKEVLYIYLD